MQSYYNEPRPGTIRAEVADMFDAGYGAQEMADELGVSYRSVKNALYGMDLIDTKIPKKEWRGELGRQWTEITQRILRNGRK